MEKFIVLDQFRTKAEKELHNYDLLPLMMKKENETQDLNDYKVIWDKENKSVVKFVSPEYNLVNHKQIVLPVTDLILKIDSNAVGAFRLWGFQLEALFILSGLKIRVGKSFVRLGIRLLNSIISQKLRFSAFGFNSICENGMLLGQERLGIFKCVRTQELSIAQVSDIVGGLLERIFNTKWGDLFLPATKRELSSEKKDLRPFLSKYTKCMTRQTEILDNYISQADFTIWGLYNSMTWYASHRLDKRTFSLKDFADRISFQFLLDQIKFKF